MPTDVLNAGYTVMQADINGDACVDYLIQGKTISVILDLDDLVFPVLSPPRVQPLLLLSATTTGTCSYAAAPATAAQLRSTAWGASSYRVSVGDVRGDGNGSLFISAPQGSLAFNVARLASGSYSMLQVFNAKDLHLDSTGATVALVHSDADARSDLVVTQNGAVLGVYLAVADGTFAVSSPDNNAASAMAAWKQFIKYLQDSDLEGALTVVANSIRDAERAAMTAPGATPFSLPGSITQVDVSKETNGQVELVLVAPQGGQDFLYSVTLAKESDGVWRIVAF